MREWTVPIGSLVEGLEARMARAASGTWPDGLCTGLADLDEMLGGFQPGTLNILAGRPSMGKTTLTLNITSHVAVERKQTSLYVAMREELDSIATRMICAIARVDSHRLRRGRLTAEETERVRQTAARLKESPLYLCDGCGLTLDEIDTEIFTLHDWTPDADDSKQPKLAVIDSLEELSIRDDAAGDLPEHVPEESREVAYIMEQLRNTAEHQKMAILLIAPLTKEVERRLGHQPRARDLPHFHYVMRYADTVLLLHRPSYYDQKKDQVEAELVIARNRFGPTGTVNLAFDRPSLRFLGVCDATEGTNDRGNQAKQ